MHDTIRARIRSVLDTITTMTRVLTWLGFGRSDVPPTEPIQRSDSDSERAPQPAPKGTAEERSPGLTSRPERGHPER